MVRVNFVFIFFIVTICGGQHETQTPVVGIKGTKCYDSFNRPQRCIPEFENAAFNVLMEATNTCGENGEQEYCIQTGVTGIRKSCEICYPNDHHARYLTDFHNQDDPTWWQSETMLEGIQFPNNVNLTIKFGKAFDVTYIRLWFQSPRPESFSISKKTSQDGPWIPWQYYSATCRDTYGLPDSSSAIRGDETRAFCTSEYSDISPLRGGNVAFGTLEGRPSAYNFEGSPELQEWVTATEIMITLDRLNTFGDEVFGDERVLRSYFYAVADVAVGARCKCNGHASECLGASTTRVCRCEHNTAGPDCSECLPFYNDAPWGRATATDAHECKQCNCNGYSNRCVFDQQLYEQTGHGGHCLDCAANRDGPNCERCRPNYFMRPDDGFCAACECDPVGSRSLQCNSEGKCQCKPGVTGDKCDRCAENHFDFTAHGCKSCNCSAAGSAYNTPTCDAVSGTCQCKENVEGMQCQDCKPGFFNLDLDNEFGCTPCFCYGHSSECKSAAGYSKYLLESTFAKSSERWRAQDEYGRDVEIKYEGISQSIGVQASGEEMVYFIAPDRFLGNQVASYNQLLKFSLRIGDNRAMPTATDVVLESPSLSVTSTIFAQQNKLPTMEPQEYSFLLHESPKYSWQPRLSSRDFFAVLSNLTAIKIRGTYSAQGVGFLDDVQLESAVPGGPGQSALWIESCDCPQGYVGQYCESCAPGFRHSPAFGGPFASCIPCDCHGHADICDSDTGKCICQHHTTGDNCDLCARGYYGNALAGTDSDCQPCGCPDGGACIQIDDDIMCIECPLGYTGHRCDICSDGFYGDPTGRFGIPRPCEPCECSQNIDPNAIGNCNTTTGECLKCIHNTGGRSCEVCLAGYYGNALVLPKGDCKKCECLQVGTEEMEGEPICDSGTGHCNCKPHVVGKNCDKCEDGFYNLASGNGCQTCDCDATGSYNQTCDLYTGQCYCRSGVTGLRCDHCEARKYGFSVEGCKECDCDPIGSKDLQCDSFGQCPCLNNVEGRQCDRCKENKYDRHRGCLDCPDCYGLVQNATRSHRDKLVRLEDILDEVDRRPTVITDDEFPEELRKLEEDIDKFYDKVKPATGNNSTISQALDIRRREKDIYRSLSEIEENVFIADDKKQKAVVNIDHSETLLNEAGDKVAEIENTFDVEGRKALEDAWGRSNVVGQQNEKMTEIAQEARQLADQLDTKADAIVENAKEAKNKSITAYEKVKNANAQQTQISEQARFLRQDLVNAESKLNNTKAFTKEVSENARELKNQALALLNEVNNLMVPQIDIPALRSKSDALLDEAKRLELKTGLLFNDTINLRNDIEEKTRDGGELLQQAYDQQDEIDELLNDIHDAKSTVDQKIEDWNKLLNNTESIYKDLKDFDFETQKSKEEAEAALKTIGELEDTIRETLYQTAEAQVTLREAAETANSALKKAEDADDLAKNTSDEAKELRAQIEELDRNTTGLIDESDQMQQRIVETEERLNNLAVLARSNDTLITNAKDKVGMTGKQTEEVSKRVEELLGDVEAILVDLQNSPNITDEDLDKLEEEIHRAEERIRNAQLDEKLASLQQEHKVQNELISEYINEISRLQKDVNNIEQIVKALPDGCFRRVELEP